MLEYMIPEGTDTAEARRLLTGKGEADLRKQGAALFDSLKAINAECRIVDDSGAETGFDYQKSGKLSGTDSDRNAQLMRMTAERRAIREELRERADRALIAHEIDSPLPSAGNAYTDREQPPTASLPAVNPNLPARYQIEAQVESLVGNHVQALLDQSGSGAGFDSAKGGRPFLETHRSITVPGLTLDAVLGTQFGHPRATMTQVGTGGAVATGYKPFTYRDLREALMTSQINNYTGMLQRRSTEGQLKINYLQENAQTLNAGVAGTAVGATGEAVASTESNFTVTEQDVNLRKIATHMEFSIEELRSRSDFVGFMTTRLARAVANRLEIQLVKGNNNASNSGQLHGLVTYEAGAAQGANTIGVDEIEKKISSMENVMGQMATGILMEHTGITSIRTWHVSTTTGQAQDLRYIFAHPSDRGPMVLWDVPVVKVPVLDANDVIVVDTMPIICYDDGNAMEVRFTDSHGSNFIADVMTANTHVWANAAYTRHVPGSAPLNHKYVERITGFALTK